MAVVFLEWLAEKFDENTQTTGLILAYVFHPESIASSAN